jgi:hypothetical protein
MGKHIMTIELADLRQDIDLEAEEGVDSATNSAIHLAFERYVGPKSDLLTVEVDTVTETIRLLTREEQKSHA